MRRTRATSDGRVRLVVPSRAAGQCYSLPPQCDGRRDLARMWIKSMCGRHVTQLHGGGTGGSEIVIWPHCNVSHICDGLAVRRCILNMANIHSRKSRPPPHMHFH